MRSEAGSKAASLLRGLVLFVAGLLLLTSRPHDQSKGSLEAPAPKWRAPNWSGLKAAALVAVGLGVLVILLFGEASKRWAVTPPLLFPYLAAATVFFSTCAWILWEGRFRFVIPMSRSRAPDSASSWASVTFILASILLIGGGMAGHAGNRAIENMNCYLFGGPCEIPWSAQKLVVWFNYIGAIGIATALATLVFIGRRCVELTTKGCANGDVLAVLRHGRDLFHQLVLASALTVTSTLTLFLLFGSADQIEAAKVDGKLVPRTALDAGSQSAKAIPGSEAQPALTAKDAKNSKRTSSAAYMAFVAGISFSGALFMLFLTCGKALDEQVEAILTHARDAETMVRDPKRSPSARFSVKDWREQHGVSQVGAVDRLFQALALLAPALTGALTLMAGA